VIPQLKFFMPKTVDKELLSVLHSGFIGQGEKVNQFDNALAGISGIDLIPAKYKEGSSSWLYTLHTKNRGAFMHWMMDQGIQVSRVHERNDKYTAFAESATELPNLDRFNATQVSIPVGWWLSLADKEEIVAKIKEFVEMKFLYEA
jgi:perosamine synthetase